MLVLYDSALSPFCRKVRMVLELKGLAFEARADTALHELGHLNSRAEIPIMLDGDLVVVNSADIAAYLDHAYPDTPVYPRSGPMRVLARKWERIADTLVDAIVTDLAIWNWAEIGACPPGLLEAGKRDLAEVYDELEVDLAGKNFICEELSIADLALFPHLAAAWHIQLGCSAERHPRADAWLKRMRNIPVCRADLSRVKAWWSSHRAQKSDDTLERARVNWGSFRLEWLLANGHADWFAHQVREKKVIWSVGQHRNGIRPGSK